MRVFRSRLGLRRFAPAAPGAPARRGGGAEVVMPAVVGELASGAAPLSHEAHGIK